MDSPKASGGIRSSKVRVYIVDDQVLLRRGVASVIRSEPGMEFCGEAADYRSAVKGVRELRPDVLITELFLKGENGTEFIKRIKSAAPWICVVVLTHHSDVLHAPRALKAGASALIGKQASPEKIVSGIRSARNGQIDVSENVSSLLLGRMVNGQDSDSFSPLTSLSSRELEIFKMIGSGDSTRDIAVKLGISVKTVEAHRAHIKEKAGLESGFELMHSAIRWSGRAVQALA